MKQKVRSVLEYVEIPDFAYPLEMFMGRLRNIQSKHPDALFDLDVTHHENDDAEHVVMLKLFEYVEESDAQYELRMKREKNNAEYAVKKLRMEAASLGFELVETKK